MGDTQDRLDAVRNSHTRLSELSHKLTGEQIEGPSACQDWTVAQVYSHLGSQSEIFELFLDAGLGRAEPPGGETFQQIWAVWDARSPADQVARSVAANEALVGRFNAATDEQRRAFSLNAFGRNVDFDGLLQMRLGEHALHTWDVAVVDDPAAVVAPDAVDLLVDVLPEMAGRAGKAKAELPVVMVTATDPDRGFKLVPDGVRLEATAGQATDAELATATQLGLASVHLPAEALVRLVYGRLSARYPAQGKVETEGVTIEDLQELFPGF
jgi:uncharacterized protein (TIGR03083 family)